MISNEKHFLKLEHMYLSAPVNQYYAPAIHISEGQAQVTIPIRPDFFHAANAVHGAVYFKLLDDSAFFAASSLVKDVFVLTVSYNVYFMRPVSAGVMKATGRIVQASLRLIVAESVVVDSEEREIARGSGTFIRSMIKLTEEIGYK
jgi:uncharacterized protein (TIGR00369 family)